MPKPLDSSPRKRGASGGDFLGLKHRRHLYYEPKNLLKPTELLHAFSRNPKTN